MERRFDVDVITDATEQRGETRGNGPARVGVENAVLMRRPPRDHAERLEFRIKAGIPLTGLHPLQFRSGHCSTSSMRDPATRQPQLPIRQYFGPNDLETLKNHNKRVVDFRILRSMLAPVVGDMTFEPVIN